MQDELTPPLGGPVGEGDDDASRHPGLVELPHQRVRQGLSSGPVASARIIALSFIGVIGTGWLLLLLPWATAEGRSMPPVDALFTATTAVCVTGLVVRDTGSQLSAFGQVVVLLLLQVGGLGYMVLSTVGALALGQRLRLREQLVVQQALGGLHLHDVIQLLKMTIFFTVVIELTGALLLTMLFWLRLPGVGLARAVAYGIFHSASAFCNAGLDLMGREFGPYASLTPFVGDFGISLTVAALIILGGLGFVVLTDLLLWVRHAPSLSITRLWSRYGKWGAVLASRYRLSYHSQLVLCVTAWLLASSTLLLLLLEYTNPHTLAPLPWHHRILAAFFQAVTPRTAGFATLDYAQMRAHSLLLTVVLMFIGASPGGTGGGVKTTTAAVLLAAVIAALRNNPEAQLLRRCIPHDLVYRALTLVVLSATLLVVALCVLAYSEEAELQEVLNLDHPFLHLLFEAVSAFGTVGLSTGITPYLTDLGKLVLILLMYVGRVGSLTVPLAIVASAHPAHRQYPVERVVLG